MAFWSQTYLRLPLTLLALLFLAMEFSYFPTWLGLLTAGILLLANAFLTISPARRRTRLKLALLLITLAALGYLEKFIVRPRPISALTKPRIMLLI
jgi:hypothetical protein